MKLTHHSPLEAMSLTPLSCHLCCTFFFSQLNKTNEYSISWVKMFKILLKLWLSFFCLSFCKALRSSSVRGSSLIGMFGILEVDLDVSWLKKSRRELALTSPDIMFISPSSITLISGTVPSSRVASVWSNLSRNSSQETDWKRIRTRRESMVSSESSLNLTWLEFL